MITPNEEAIGRLQGLRHVVQGGNVKAAGALIGELETLANDKIDLPDARDAIASVVGFINKEIAGGNDKADLEAVTERIDATLDSLDKLLNEADGGEAAEAPAAEQPKPAPKPAEPSGPMMITPEEEALCRLQGLRHMVKGGNLKAAESLSAELGQIASEKLTLPEAKEPIAEVTGFINEQITSGAGGDNVEEILERIEKTLTTVEAALNPEDESAAETAAAESEEEAPSGAHIELDMLPVFLREAVEHLDSSEQHLLELEQEPGDSDALDAVFRGFHSMKGNAGFVGLTKIGKLAHEAETMFDLIRSGKAQLTEQSAELALRSVDALRQMVDDLGATDEPVDAMPPEGKELVEELIEMIKSIETGGPPPERKKPAKKEPEPEQSADSAPKAKEEKPAEAAGKGADAKAGDAKAKAKKKPDASSFVRVDQGRLDDLVNLIGELVIAESIVTASVAAVDEDGETEQPLQQLGKITRELQHLSLSLRMVPIHDLFQKQIRLVRDLGRKLDKPVELVIEGGGTELDKNVVDKLADPLVHIIRNSIDHGVEPDRKDRLAAGKPETAKVTLSAGYEGGQIRISIRDDGRGLNREKILAKAVARGVLPADTDVPGYQIDQLIFNAGLSTAEKVTDVSGRGVGMDVVARNIESLRGTVKVVSEPGLGTEIVITLPMTLAIIDGLAVIAGENRFVIPSYEVEQLVEVEKHQWEDIASRQPVITVRGRHIPVFPLGGMYGFQARPEAREDGVVVLARTGDHSFGLLVDRVAGRQQVVIKQLGEAIGSVKGIAGGAVMTDGHVALIVDVPGLHQRISNTQESEQ